ncbi:MAG: YfbM family protein [Pirellulales bacterium]
MSMIGNSRRVTRSQLAALRDGPATISAFLYDEEPPPDAHIDLDKAWHAIHFLLNGRTWDGNGPLFHAVLGGETLGEEDVGYGPARFLTADEVKVTAQALADISPADFLKPFDAQALNDNEIDPQHWTGEDIDLHYVRNNFVRLVEFFRSATQHDDALLLYLN